MASINFYSSDKTLLTSIDQNQVDAFARTRGLVIDGNSVTMYWGIFLELLRESMPMDHRESEIMYVNVTNVPNQNVTLDLNHRYIINTDQMVYIDSRVMQNSIQDMITITFSNTDLIQVRENFVIHNRDTEMITFVILLYVLIMIIIIVKIKYAK